MPVRERLLFTAAADHCLGAAYAGECPGVDVAEFTEFRLKQRAKFQGRSVEEVRADTLAAISLIKTKMDDTPGQVVDMTGSVIPELPAAACQLGVAVLAGPLDTPDGRHKIVLQSATSDQIQSFLDGDLAPGLVDRYGDPARGFAGGYQAHCHACNDGTALKKLQTHLIDPT